MTGEAGQVSLTQLVLLWTAGLSLCAVSLGEEVFVLPATLLVSVLACLVAVSSRRDVQVWWIYAVVVGGGLLTVGFAQFVVYAWPYLDHRWLAPLLATYIVLGVAAAMTAGRGSCIFGGFVAVHCVLVAVLLRNVPVVADVQSLLDGGVSAFLRGIDPYSITVPAVYGPEKDWNYGPGVLVDGRIAYGYPYLPLPLLFVIPAYLVGDVRLALVLAMVVTALLLRRLATDRLGRLASVLVLVMPVSWAMQLSYWVEPVLLLVVAICAHSMQRGSGRAALWFGCFLASKQYAVVHLPYLWMLMRAHDRRSVLVALAVPALLCSIFLAWNPQAFWHSAVEFHLRQPYRYDTVTLTPALERVLGASPDFLFGPYGFVIGTAVSTFVAWRCRPSASTLSAGIGLSLALAVLFSKQGHANYWGLIGGALLIAAATNRESTRVPEVRWHSSGGDLAESGRPAS